ncbi:hypothetical protein MRB53_020783 [Persea americana]|uniref:Uncharacterized protein n=1 Tax=Persea americana TaxID=3435 RepID=A0ACC2L1R3_PERAE|nr:hypothetical protein MRB53_020783 [Persea americana]
MHGEPSPPSPSYKFGIGKSNLHLNWPACFDICLGITRGLAYLHEESRPQIVHRDVKVSNILLDADLNPNSTEQ